MKTHCNDTIYKRKQKAEKMKIEVKSLVPKHAQKTGLKSTLKSFLVTVHLMWNWKFQ